jgi:tetraprenyl-beta-curcumene synthase
LRERHLLAWWQEYRSVHPELLWNEFAAATGSTLGMLMLFLAATDPGLDGSRVDGIVGAYFPFICGLHIMLDYLIDQAEDEAGGDLNFCRYYRDGEQLTERLLWIVERARQAAAGLPFPRFHRMVVEGLIALYLSDPKIRDQRQVLDTARAIMRGSPLTRVFFRLNSLWIRKTQTPEMEVVR